MTRTDSARAFALCEEIARERAQSMTTGDFADGYRCAAEDIVRAIAAKRDGRPLDPLERELRDAEIEARTLARVTAVALRIVADVGTDAAAADSLRTLVGAFFAQDDLPPALRRCAALESMTTLVTRRCATG